MSTPVPKSSRARRRGGFTLVEISIAMAVVLIAIGGALSSISVTSTLAEASKESNRAYAAASRST